MESSPVESAGGLRNIQKSLEVWQVIYGNLEIQQSSEGVNAVSWIPKAPPKTPQNILESLGIHSNA